MRPAREVRVVRGRLLERGRALHRFGSDKKPSPTYVVTVENDTGERVPVYGVDLERALTAAQVEVGMPVVLQRIGHVSIERPGERSRRMNVWHAKRDDESDQ